MAAEKGLNGYIGPAQGRRRRCRVLGKMPSSAKTAPLATVTVSAGPEPPALPLALAIVATTL